MINFTKEAFDAALATFVAGAQKIVHEGRFTGPEYSLFVDPRGTRYKRIVIQRPVNSGVIPDRSVYCFVDTTNGDVLKADGWKKPAKHARGNIFNADNGLGGVNWFGGVYLR